MPDVTGHSPPQYEEVSHNNTSSINNGFAGAADDTKPGLPPIQVPLPLYSQNVPPQLPLPNSSSIPGTSSLQVTEDMVAAEALTRLNGTPPPVGAISTPMSNLSIEDRQHPLITKVNQVSRHPIVRDAFKYYETSKRNYPHFNYAAGIVEAAAIPVVNRIELNLNNRHRERLERPKQKKKRKLNSKKDKTETRKRLQFCLHLLRLANDQINNQVNFLQSKISECESKTDHSGPNEKEIVSGDNEKNGTSEMNSEKDDAINVDSNSVGLTPTTTGSTASAPVEVAQQTKTEIITTVKKIIHVISNFKASSLTSDAGNAETNNELKSTIRDIILKLPSQIQQTTLQSNTSTQQANDKILVFAKDSLDMIGRLTNVFNEQLQKAENWIGEEEYQRQLSGTPTPAPNNTQENGNMPLEQSFYGDNKIQS